jgi:hypothetical protein
VIKTGVRLFDVFAILAEFHSIKPAEFRKFHLSSKEATIDLIREERVSQPNSSKPHHSSLLGNL